MMIQNALDWIEHCEAINQFWFVGVFLATAIMIVCVWKWLTKDIG
ncbi:hypothetical protein LCGC14_0421280 [marine sediment metagenome]|uniref:Uncharacterized protein n=1 Tax=marine sediment metagenome TaxID=412755 RepID=A0A0F9VCW9_9ZZZZ